MLVQLEASWSGIDILLRVAVANLNGIDNRIHRASPEFDRMAAGQALLQQLRLKEDDSVFEMKYTNRGSPSSTVIIGTSFPTRITPRSGRSC